MKQLRMTLFYLILRRLDKFDQRLTKLEKEQSELLKSVNFISDELEDVKAAIKLSKRDPYRKEADLLGALEKISEKLGCNLNS